MRGTFGVSSRKARQRDAWLCAEPITLQANVCRALVLLAGFFCFLFFFLLSSGDETRVLPMLGKTSGAEAQVREQAGQLRRT